MLEKLKLNIEVIRLNETKFFRVKNSEMHAFLINPDKAKQQNCWKGTFGQEYALKTKTKNMNDKLTSYVLELD